jgi:hypothetical protein
MRRFEGNRCLQATLSARYLGLRTNGLSQTSVAPRLAFLAMLRNVLELLSVKEKLLTSRKHKLGSAVDALYFFVNKIHATSRKSVNGWERLSGRTIS